MRFRMPPGKPVDCVIYRPGDDGFAALASQVVPLCKIKSPHPLKTLIWDGGSQMKPKTRKENYEELR